jgi:D-alanyl-D-alanine carboxypeptidase
MKKKKRLMLPSGNDAALALAEHFGKLLFRETAEYRERMEENCDFEHCIKLRDSQKYFLQEMNR